MTRGNAILRAVPARLFTSDGLTPEVASRTRTSPGPGRGVSISPTLSTSAAAPFFSYQAARMGGLLRRMMGFGGRRLNPSYNQSHRRSCARSAKASSLTRARRRMRRATSPVGAGAREHVMGKRFTYWIIGGLILGAVVGYILNNTLPDQKTAAVVTGYFSLIIELFLRLIKRIIATLAMWMLIVGIAHMGT